MTIAANKLITAEEFAAMTGDGLHELVRGEVIEMPTPGARHGEIANQMGYLLKAHVLSRNLGKVLNNDAGYILQRDPDTARGPDVSFIRRDRVPVGGLPDGPFPGAPDIAIEVLSPNDRIGDIDEKIDMYLAAGCPLVVVLHPKRRTAELHRPGTVPVIVREPEALDLSSVVDGFQCTLAEIFG